MLKEKEVRKSVIAGSWYPGKPEELRADIEKYFNAVPEMEFTGDIISLVVPHAGYLYSGQVAAYAYKRICGKHYDAVVVVGPSHRVAFHGVSVYPRGGYETPLGVVPVDDDLSAKIISLNAVVQEIPAAHLQEHAIEIQLPFLQVALGEFPFVPLVMGNQDEFTCRELAESIAKASNGKKILVVGSSDLSHFYNYQKALKLDAVAIKYLERADAEGLLKSLNDYSTEACGGGPMAVAMMSAKKMGGQKAQVLKYANSADVTGDKSSVVGYVSALFYQ